VREKKEMRRILTLKMNVIGSTRECMIKPKAKIWTFKSLQGKRLCQGLAR
jgi:hypothetical protein